MRQLVGLVLVVACGGPKPSPEPATTATADPAPLGPLCVKFYARQRVCVDDYLSRQLAVRAEYDMPPGIAAERARDGDEAVIARMRPEFERDTDPAKTDGICKQIAESTPPEAVPGLLAEGENCLAKTDCPTFAHCAIETEREYIRTGGSH